MLLGPKAVASWEDGAVGSSRWSLRSMVSANQCGKGAGDAMVAGAKVTGRPLSESLCQWGSVQRLEMPCLGSTTAQSWGRLRSSGFLYCCSGC